METYTIEVPKGIEVGNKVFVKATDKYISPAKDNYFVLVDIIGLGKDCFYCEYKNGLKDKVYYNELGKTVFLESEIDKFYYNNKYEVYELKVEYRCNWPIEGDRFYCFMTDMSGAITIAELVYVENTYAECAFNSSFSIGLVFRTKEEAELALERLKVKAKLKRLSEESMKKYDSDIGGFIFIKYLEDPYDFDQKYTYNISIDNISNAISDNTDLICFSSYDDALNAWKEIGNDNMLKLYFSNETIKKYNFRIFNELI